MKTIRANLKSIYYMGSKRGECKIYRKIVKNVRFKNEMKCQSIVRLIYNI